MISEPTDLPLPRASRLHLRAVAIALCVSLALAAAGIWFFVIRRGGWYEPISVLPSPASGQVFFGSEAQGIWVAVDVEENILRIFRGEELLREAACSAGSGGVLQDPRSDRLWVFDTPLGERRVVSKARNPVWIKPDWAFVEEGEVPPPMSSPKRRDEVSLGDYALYLGDGYLIHGTLFPSLLGSGVTHGCIRLADSDLEYLYRHVPIGARVVLY